MKNQLEFVNLFFRNAIKFFKILKIYILFEYILLKSNFTSRSQLHRTCDQPIGYPHRAPALRLDCRRTSISVDDVNRRPSIASYQFAMNQGSSNNSGCNSPDSNLLQVTQQLLVPGRRHSDNTIQPPRILLQDMFGKTVTFLLINCIF